MRKPATAAKLPWKPDSTGDFAISTTPRSQQRPSRRRLDTEDGDQTVFEFAMPLPRAGPQKPASSDLTRAEGIA